MAHSLSPQTVGSIASIVLLVAIGGIMADLYLVQARVATIPPQPTKYDTTVLDKDLKIDPTNREANIFIRTTLLRQDSRIKADQVTYKPEELGKTDLIHSGQ